MVRVESVLGEGAEFTIRLPLYGGEPPAKPRANVAPLSAQEHTRRIMVVDDEVAVAALFEGATQASS
jgi:hypothetical protein